jgi:hypothetical protein
MNSPQSYVFFLFKNSPFLELFWKKFLSLGNLELQQRNISVYYFFIDNILNLGSRMNTYIIIMTMIMNQLSMILNTIKFSITSRITMKLLRIMQHKGTVYTVMGTHSFIRYFVTVTVTSLVMAVTNKFLFSSAFNEVTEAIGDLKND